MLSTSQSFLLNSHTSFSFKIHGYDIPNEDGNASTRMHPQSTAVKMNGGQSDTMPDWLQKSIAGQQTQQVVIRSFFPNNRHLDIVRFLHTIWTTDHIVATHFERQIHRLKWQTLRTWRASISKHPLKAKPKLLRCCSEPKR
ncbi:hypothetical protein Mapa_013504 [Marchantia paleacea]|nr:hypothetical protein Mapa_013504 [Marchantia paleacea]